MPLCGVATLSHKHKKERTALKSKLSWMRQPAALFIILLMLSSAVIAGTGLLLKHTAGRSSATVQSTLAIAVPFLFVRGEVSPEEIFPPKALSQPTAEETAEESIFFGPFGEQGREGEPLPEVSYHHVEEDYFDTALFIGDSRTEGMKLYGRLGEADYFASAGMSMFNLFEKRLSDRNFGEQDLCTLLTARQYEMIYLSLGINEAGYPVASLEARFTYVIGELRRLQPEARLVLLLNLTVTREKAESSESLNLANINALNALIASHADNETIFIIDPNVLFAGEDGYLRGEFTGDGVHPYAREYRNLAIWLKDFGI